MIAIEDPGTGLLIDQPSPAAPNADPAAYIIVEAEPFSELEQSAPEAISIILVGPVLYGALWHSTAAALAAYVCAPPELHLIYSLLA
jgi:hypothetical protein